MSLLGLKSGLGKAQSAVNSNMLQDVVRRFLLPSKSLKAPNEHLPTAPTGPHSTSPKHMFTHLLQKLSDQHEMIVGVDIIPGRIRVCQLEEVGSGWQLTHLASADIEGDVTTANMFEHVELYTEKLKTLLKDNKIKAKNAAVAIPASSAIIKTLSMPLMTDEEIDQAIAMGSFWQNLVALPGELEEYSVFHEVMRRDTVTNTMDMLFVGARISDISVYTQIISNAGLHPIIVDVRCFALNNIHHINSYNVVREDPVAFLKFGPDENYVHIIDQGESFMYDIYISDEDRNTIMDHFNDAEILQRYATQARQIVSNHESKAGTHKVKDIFVVSLLPSIETFVGKLSAVLTEYNVSECNFFDHIEIPEKFLNKIKEEKNRSAWAVAMGLAARRLDIFNEFKGVTGSDNVNLLPGNQEVKETKKVSLISVLSLVPVAIVCVMIAFVSYTSALKEDTKVTGELVVLGQVDSEFGTQNKKYNELKKATKQLATLEVIQNEFASNQQKIVSAYQHINDSVPEGVWLAELSFTAPGTIQIVGNSMSDQNVMAFIKGIKSNELFARASLKTLQVNTKYDTTLLVKSFAIICELVQPEGVKQEIINKPVNTNVPKNTMKNTGGAANGIKS